MATSEFVEIAAFANAVEAEHVRSVLEENGVSAFIDGAAANTALSYVGTALGGVKVFVRAADAVQAREIVEDQRAGSDVSVMSWFCGTCEETVDGTFEVCWSCGQDRARAERPFPVTRDGDHFKSDCGSGGDDVADTVTPDYSAYDVANPYASPTTVETTTPSHRQAEINEDAEAILLRAWRASIIGIVFFPFILHLYSMWLLMRAAMTAPRFSPDGQMRFCGAFVVNVVAGCVCGMIIRLLLG